MTVGASHGRIVREATGTLTTQPLLLCERGRDKSLAAVMMFRVGLWRSGPT